MRPVNRTRHAKRVNTIMQHETHDFGSASMSMSAWCADCGCAYKWCDEKEAVLMNAVAYDQSQTELVAVEYEKMECDRVACTAERQSEAVISNKIDYREHRSDETEWGRQARPNETDSENPATLILRESNQHADPENLLEQQTLPENLLSELIGYENKSENTFEMITNLDGTENESDCTWISRAGNDMSDMIETVYAENMRNGLVYNKKVNVELCDHILDSLDSLNFDI